MDETEAISALSSPRRANPPAGMRLLVGERDGMAAGDIAGALKVRQNTLSSHIAALTRCGLIDGHRQGRKIVYTADSGKARRLGTYVLTNLGEISDGVAAKLLRK